MKQTKWQRLATIGLCSSLVINAFSGVTAVAETVTSESSPTVASSTTQESTESSQETTETSREEVTQETEKQAEIPEAVSYTHLRAHETRGNLVCRLLLEKNFFNDTATTEIYTRSIVGSVRCV